MYKWKKNLNLYHKFFLTFIFIGIIPLLLVSTVIMNRLFNEYENALLDSYTQSIEYTTATIDGMLDSYNDIVKILYHYNVNDQTSSMYSYNYMYSIKDVLERKPENYGVEEIEKLKKKDMEAFLSYVFHIDTHIKSAHFIDTNKKVYSYSGNIFANEEMKLKNTLNSYNLDKASKEMMIFTMNPNEYSDSESGNIFTIGRNYFDLSGAIGKLKYMGTLMIHVDTMVFESVFTNMEVYKKGTIYITDQNNHCIFSNKKKLIGKEITTEINEMQADKNDSVIIKRKTRDQWNVYFHLTYQMVFARLRQIQKIMFWIIGISVIALMMSSVVFSKRLTSPIRKLMKQMSRVEAGDFQIEIPVTSNDELGVLTKRFNQMAKELNRYINKSYLAQIKQTEAELTTLKSQIYPHFLYNTLEVIRMTAVKQDNMIVSDMIESLSDQIHYIIGPVKDMVPLKMEIEIIKKYIFLLNCRTQGKINLTVELNGFSKLKVPKLILQPIIENAYLHGIKPKNGVGNILITADVADDIMEIALMDNGVGMDENELKEMITLLKGDEIGIKDQHNWHSVGLKNVHDRIRYLYGEDYGIHITSTPSVGTLIRIIMPYLGKAT